MQESRDMATKKKSLRQPSSRKNPLGLVKLDPVKVASAQGVKPIEDPSEAFAPFWPAKESAEEFNQAVRAWRKEGRGKDEL